MKSLARSSFFRLFEWLLSSGNPGLKRAQWSFDGIDFTRERHSFSGPRHGFSVEIFTLTREGRRGWTLMVTKEYWWAGAENKILKNPQWARQTAGKRADMMSWIRTQEIAFNRPSPASMITGSGDGLG